MNKIEKDVLAEFISKIIKSGAMVNNVNLPQELHVTDGEGNPNPFGATKVITMQEVLNAWNECTKSLRSIDENKSRTGK